MCEIQFVVLLYAKLHIIFFHGQHLLLLRSWTEASSKHLWGKCIVKETFSWPLASAEGFLFLFFSESRVAECLTTVATFPFPLSCRPTYSKGGLYRLSLTMRSFHFIARWRDTMRALFLSYFIIRTEAIHWKSSKNILESKRSFSLPNMTCFRA